MEVVKPRDLRPFLMSVTDTELADMVEWLQDHQADGLPPPLARVLIAGEYMVAYDRRDPKWSLETVTISADRSFANDIGESKKRRWWHR